MPDQNNQWCAVLKGRVNSVGCIRCPGPACHGADARLAGHLGVRVGHIGGGPFLAADDGLDAVLVIVQPIQEVKKAFAGNAEHGFRPQLVQLVGQNVASGARHWLTHFQNPFLYLKAGDYPTGSPSHLFSNVTGGHAH